MNGRFFCAFMKETHDIHDGFAARKKRWGAVTTFVKHDAQKIMQPKLLWRDECELKKNS
jgi:hypothetical protein